MIKKPSPPPPRKAAPPPAGRTESKKKFHIEDWDGGNEGEKGIIYAPPGMGKTTLASMLPDPVFLGLDDGGRKIRNPKTGEVLKRIPDVETYQDVRDALAQRSLYDSCKSLVVDTGTKLETWALQWVLQNIKVGKDSARNIESYGYAKGYRHVYDAMHLILSDLDSLVRAGINVFIICQLVPVRVANPGGEDYLCDAPELQDRKPSVLSDYLGWCDHTLKIGYEGVVASDKKATSSGSRIICVHPEIHYKAKSRTIPREYPLLTFDSPDDDTVWQYVFNEVWRKE